MRVTSFKDVEIYIYSSVVLPLKRLNVSELPFASPIQSNEGRTWKLSIRRETLDRLFRRNYQRTQANRGRDWIVYLDTGEKSLPVARYKLKSHKVIVYEEPFRALDAMPLMGTMCSVFNKNTPFTKIILEDAMLPPRPRRRNYDEFVDAHEAPDYPDDDEEEYWDD